MIAKTTTLTAALALSFGLSAGTALAQNQPVVAPPATEPGAAAPAPAAPAADATTPAPVTPPGPGTANVPPTAEPIAPPTTGGTPEPVTPAPEVQPAPGAEAATPAPPPTEGPAAEAAAETGTTTTPVPATTPGNGEPPATTQDSPAQVPGDAQPEVTGSGDPNASTLANEPAPGQAGAETPQAAAPVVTPQSPAATESAPGTAPAELQNTPTDPAAPTTAVSTPGSDAPPATAPAGTEPAPPPDAGSATGAAPESAATPAEAAAAAPDPAAAAAGGTPDPNQPTPPEAPGPDASEAAAAEAGPVAGEAAATEGEAHQEFTDINFSFEGPLGKYNQFQLQRGLQVYTEVCSACHGLKYVPIRTLHDEGGPGLPEDQVRAYAATMDIDDPATGESRPRVPTDHFPENTSAGAPDLSVMAKARAAFHGPAGTGINQLVKGIGGAEYIYSILTHYPGETKEEAGSTFYANTSFPGGWIKMAPPLQPDQVTYEDGTPATVENMAQDVAAFLMWTAEPHMMTRKRVGLMAVVFLIGLSTLLYFTNKRLWYPVKHPRRET